MDHRGAVLKRRAMGAIFFAFCALRECFVAKEPRSRGS